MIENRPILVFPFHLVQDNARRLKHPGGQPGDEHDPQSLGHPVFCAGGRLDVVGQVFVDQSMGLLRATDLPGPTGQPDKHEIKLAIIDQIIGFIVQMAVDIAKGAIDAGMSENAVFVNDDIEAPTLTADMLKKELRKGDIVLFKASRAVAAERIIELIKNYNQR